MKLDLSCPTCGSDDIMKNGTTRRGKQNHKCRDCGRQFVEDPQWKPKDKDIIALVNLLLLEKIPLAGIVRTIGVSASWLLLGALPWSGNPTGAHPQNYVNKYYQQVEKQAEVVPKAKGKLTVQMDELWSFVDNKGNKQWVWIAIDARTREIIGCEIGDRSRASARKLWNSLPGVYKQCAKVYPDMWEAYEKVVPSKRHFAVGTETGLTNYIERLNNTLRQRISRLVRKSSQQL
jgi:insertion element IS1 protein InsB